METTAAERSAQLEWEGRFGRPAGLAALAMLLLPLAAQVVVVLVAGERPRDPARGLELAYERRELIVAVASLPALGLVLLGAALAFLAKASRFRRPATLPGALPIAIVGALAAAGSTVFTLVVSLGIASEYVTAGPRTVERARELTEVDTGPRLVAAQVDLAARVAFGLALVITAVSAMRAGLLSRFLGVLGIVAGVTIVYFGFAQSFLLFFWAGAISLVLLDRLPGGRGPAWETGEATPWPSAAEQRARTMREREERTGDEGSSGAGATEPGAATDADSAERGGPQQQPRRKRKRRR